jgi:hypothetical protein
MKRTPKGYTVKDIADRYFKEQCRRLGPVRLPRKRASRTHAA